MFLILLFPLASSQCLNIITELTMLALLDRLHLATDIASYFYLSGKSVNDFGQYQHCLRDYEYAVFQFAFPQAPLTINMGLCVSQLCPVSALNDSMVHVERLVGILAQKYLNLKLTDYKLVLYDPVQQERQSSQLLFPFTALLVLYLLLYVALTFRNRQQPNPADDRALQDPSLDINKVSTMMEESGPPLQDDPELNASHTRVPRFDLPSNLARCFEPSASPFDVLNGFRALAFVMTLFGTTGVGLLIQANFITLLHYQKHFVQLIVFGCFYAVDIFLWLSGFFAVVTLSGKRSLWKTFLERVWRFWILQAIIIATNIILIPELGQGPRWFYIERYSQSSLWWENLLFINNFDDNNDCSPWLWYLALDLQLTLYCVLTMYLYRWSKHIAIFFTAQLLVAATALSIYYSYTKEYQLPYFSYFNLSDMKHAFYYRPWFRCGPYLVGMLLGFVQINKGRARIREWVGCTLQGLGLAIILYLSFGWYDVLMRDDSYYPQWFQSIYVGSMRLVYALALTLVALPNLLGLKNTLSEVMNCTLIQHLVENLFSAYLVHFLISEVVMASFYQGIDFNVQIAMQFYIFVVFASIFFGVIFRVLFELPLTGKYAKLSQHKTALEQKLI